MHRLLFVCLIALCATSGGCYYGQLASGQLKLLWSSQPIEEAIEDPAHADSDRALLRLVESVRVYAGEMGLHADDQYTRFVDWPGDRIVTTLVRTRPGSVEAVPYWFPIVGHLPYKGYFDRSQAETEAERLRLEDAFEVCVSPVVAYSTLGWLDDPVTSPMLARGPASLVETILHELVHATVFLDDAADFNESAALFIGQEASIRFFERMESEGAPEDPESELPSAARVRAAIEDRRLVADRTLEFREAVQSLEGSPEREVLREADEAATRRDLAALPLQVLDAQRISERARLSDACLALRGTYIRDLPRHARVLAALDGNLEAMIERLALWAEEERSPEEFFRVTSSFESDAESVGAARISGR